MSRKKLPIGIQTFARIREDDCYYVDKTGIALQLIEEGSYYFLSRPRRFGKSLFLDTLAELFAGNEPLFRGLMVHDQWDWSRRHPVIRISFADGVLRSRQEMDIRIAEILSDNEQVLGVRGKHASIPGRFADLIRKAERVHGQRVVVLIDEYDKPILDNLTRPEVACEIRDGLRNLYSVIKGQDAHIHFAILTGVSKFSKVSLFSGLNNLRDISLSSAYSAICGYTDEDVDTVFAAELEGLERDEIRNWYNGYNWTGTSVYNPFDLLLLFREREFRPYWFETGTPTFLIDLLTARRTFAPDLERVVALESLLSSFDVDQIPTEALMFQAGYLTIDSVRRLPGQMQMTLRYPNQEVRSSLNGALLQAWSDNPARHSVHVPQLYDLLLANDFAGMRNLFTAFFASIPHDWYRNAPIAQYEGYWASVFYSHFAALGLDIRLEDVTNRGCIDMTVLFNGHVYLFEFKVVELVPQGKALQQIRERGYAEKYRARGEPIHLIGVEFSRERRSVVGFEAQWEQDN
ncbi:ATP-binding protein [Azotobacter chroococcum]|uniref:ATP-binding protein n=1 Tax=Azotobacter chroococcum TaxID=353 RepID=A0AA44C716_9GAMM|nr:ATP-binding protein [Azotobacter chroococcum]NHN75978.1 ATP-binding protein [Azotobacter chroococcum]